jgi:subtilisin family serine protease
MNRGFKRICCPRGVLFFLISCLLSQQGISIDKKIFEAAYDQGKAIFYRTLKAKAIALPLGESDRQLLLNAEKKIPELYEHLMNFYASRCQKEEPNEASLCSYFLRLSTEMAEELIQAILEANPPDGMTDLRSVLTSAGYYSRKMSPICRKYLRPMASYARAQWAFQEMSVTEAHALTKGKGVKLAIIDSGVDPTLREIRTRISKYRNFLDSSKPLADKEKFPFDWDGHGTAVASVAYQIAPEVELMIIKIFDAETMSVAPLTRWTIFLIAAGMTWAVQNGADVINLSAALVEDAKQLQETSKLCWEKNVVVVTAMGNVNNPEEKEIPSYPAAYPWTIAVGGVEKHNGRLKIWPQSAEGNYIDVVAPAAGVWVETPSYLDNKQMPRRAFGNSLATPVAAGTVALMLSAMDSRVLNNLKKHPGQVVETVRKIIRATASNSVLGLNDPNPSSGYGLINLRKAVEMAINLSKE